VVDEETARLGLAQVGVGGDVGVVHLDVGLLLHAVNHHQEEVVNGDLVNVVLLGVVVILVIVVASLLATPKTTEATVPPESGAVEDGAELVVDGVTIVVVKA